MPQTQDTARTPTNVHTVDALLPERTMTALRSALQGQFRHPAGEVDLRRAMRAMCADGRKRQLRVEKIIILLKSIWNGLPEVQGRTTSSRQDLLDRLITICVEEYYAT